MSIYPKSHFSEMHLKAIQQNKNKYFSRKNILGI